MRTETNNMQNQKPVNHGENIRFFRQLINAPLDKVAEEIGVPIDKLAKWEDTPALSLTVLKQVAKGLSLDVKYLQAYRKPIANEIFTQDGDNNTNFQKNNTVNVYHPVEAVEKAYTTQGEEIKILNSKLLDEKQRLIDSLKKENETLKNSTV